MRSPKSYSTMKCLFACNLKCSSHVLEFSPVNEKVASLRPWVGDRSLTFVSAYRPNHSIEYPAFLEALGGVLESTPTGFYWGTSMLTWAASVLSGGV